MENEISRILEEYGLSGKEIRIYLLLVRERELTAYETAKKTGIHRSTAYDILDKLIEKGFVSSVIKRKKKYYVINELSKIISFVKEKEAMLSSLLPKLEMLKKGQEVSVELLEGIEGQKEHNFTLFELAKKGKVKELYIIGNGPAPTLASEIYIEKLLSEAKKHKKIKAIEYKGIWDSNFRNKEIVKRFEHFGQNKFLKNLPSKVTTVIYGEYIALLFTIDKPYVIRIKNKIIAEEYRFYFNILWKAAKE